MAILTGLFKNSAGVNIALGRVGVTLRQLLINRSTTPDSIHTGETQFYTITAGVPNSPALPGTTLGQIDLMPTDSLSVSYRFTVETAISTTTWFLDTGEEYRDDAPRVQNLGVWYTGASYVVGESKRITPVVTSTYESIIDPFDAVVPDVPTLEFADLLQIAADFVSNPQAGIAYLAQVLTENPQYADKLRVGRWLGSYNPATTYFRGDIVSHGSPVAGWVWKLASPGSGIAPPTSGTVGNANWDYFPSINVTSPPVDLSNVVLKTGSTMSGNLVLPAPGGSPPNTIALRQAEADNNYVRVAAVTQGIAGTKNYTGTITVPNSTAGDNSTRAANTAFVVGEVLAGSGRLAQPTARVRRNAVQSLPIGSNTTIVWDNFPNAGFFDTNGVYTVPSGGAGQYMMVLMPLTFQMEGNFSAQERRFRLRVFMTVNGVDVGDFFYEDVAAVNTTSGGLNAPLQFRRSGMRIETLGVGDAVRVVANPTAGGTNSFTLCQIPSGQANNVFSIWRLAA